MRKKKKRFYVIVTRSMEFRSWLLRILISDVVNSGKERWLRLLNLLDVTEPESRRMFEKLIKQKLNCSTNILTLFWRGQENFFFRQNGRDWFREAAATGKIETKLRPTLEKKPQERNWTEAKERGERGEMEIDEDRERERERERERGGERGGVKRAAHTHKTNYPL